MSKSNTSAVPLSDAYVPLSEAELVRMTSESYPCTPASWRARQADLLRLVADIREARRQIEALEKAVRVAAATCDALAAVTPKARRPW